MKIAPYSTVFSGLMNEVMGLLLTFTLQLVLTHGHDAGSKLPLIISLDDNTNVSFDVIDDIINGCCL